MTAPRRRGGQPRPPAAQQMPRMPPALSRGTCASHPQPGLWLSGVPAEQEQAARLCSTSCEVLAVCRAWSLALPPGSDLATVLGGLDAEHRRRLRRARQRALRNVLGAA